MTPQEAVAHLQELLDADTRGADELRLSRPEREALSLAIAAASKG